MPTRADIQARVEQYVDAVGRQDLEATLALFAEDARQEDPVGSTPNVGRDEIRTFFEKAFRGDFSTTLTGPLLVTGSHAAVHFTIEVATGAEAQPRGSAATDRKPLVVRVFDLMRFDNDGLIADLHAVVE